MGMGIMPPRKIAARAAGPLKKTTALTWARVFRLRDRTVPGFIDSRSASVGQGWAGQGSHAWLLIARIHNNKHHGHCSSRTRRYSAALLPLEFSPSWSCLCLRVNTDTCRACRPAEPGAGSCCGYRRSLLTPSSGGAPLIADRRKAWLRGACIPAHFDASARRRALPADTRRRSALPRDARLPMGLPSCRQRIGRRSIPPRHVVAFVAACS